MVALGIVPGDGNDTMDMTKRWVSGAGPVYPMSATFRILADKIADKADTLLSMTKELENPMLP
jgi:hypothetical protein